MALIFREILLTPFLIIALGILASKFTRIDTRPIVTVTLWIFSPCLIFSSLINSNISFAIFSLVFFSFLFFTLGMWGASFLLGRTLRVSPEKTRAMALVAAFPNVGNFGLPVILYAFGESGLAIGIVVFVSSVLLINTLGIVIASRTFSASLGHALLNVAKSPLLYATFSALGMKALGISPPPFIMKPIGLLSGSAIPILLVLLGVHLGRSSWRISSLAEVTGTAALRLCLSPLLAWVLTYLMGIEGLLRAVIIVQFSGPAAVIPLLFSCNTNVSLNLCPLLWLSRQF